MKTEDKIILAVIAVVAVKYTLDKGIKGFFNAPEVSEKDAMVYIQKAAQARDLNTWWAPMQQKQAIAEVNRDGSTTTYFLDEEDYNSMSRWQRLLFSWDTDLKNLFD